MGELQQDEGNGPQILKSIRYKKVFSDGALVLTTMDGEEFLTIRDNQNPWENKNKRKIRITTIVSKRENKKSDCHLIIFHQFLSRHVCKNKIWLCIYPYVLMITIHILLENNFVPQWFCLVRRYKIQVLTLKKWYVTSSDYEPCKLLLWDVCYTRYLSSGLSYSTLLNTIYPKLYNSEASDVANL